jgi:hypothetical protein
MNKTIKHKILLLKQEKSKKNRQKGGQTENTNSNTLTNKELVNNDSNSNTLTNKEPVNNDSNSNTLTNKEPVNNDSNSNTLTNKEPVNNDSNSDSSLITITDTDSIYPKEYIGYKVIPKQNDLTEFIKEVEKESNFLDNNGSLDEYKLDEQVFKDLKRQITYLNKTNIIDSFYDKLKNQYFSVKLFELQPLSNIEILFKENLLKTFTKLNVDDNEINAIKQIANENMNDSSTLYYWAIIPYFDEIININGITDMNLLNNIKLFSQQSTSKTMLDNLMKYITPDNIFYHSIFISGSFSNFGSKSNTYIDKINSSLRVNIDITNNTDVIVTNKQYYSIIAPQYEFGIAIINSCMYFDFITNKYYVMWKIDRWRNNVIKNYYQMIIDFNNKSQPISQDLMELMQPLIYNNKISDSYPLTHVNLLEYYYIILSYQKDDLKQNDITNINNLVNSEIKKNTSDKEISLLIKKEITNIKNTLDIKEDTNKDFVDQEQTINEDQEQTINEDQEQPNTSQDQEQPNTNTNQDQEEPNTNTNTNQDQEQTNTNINQDQEQTNTNINTNQDQEKLNTNQDQQDEEEMQNDMDKINKAKENLENEYQNYQNDHEQIVNSQPPPSDTDKSITKLATIGSVAALGAIGAGLYFAAPLLLGGKRKKTRKYKRVNNKKKTRSNKK